MFGRKKVPDELPSLAIDSANMNNSMHNQSISPPKRELPKMPTPPQKSPPQHTNTSQPVLSSEDESGYFKELIKNVTEESKDIEKLDSWYKSKFMPSDMVFQMREYWQKQQPELLLKNVSGDLKNKLMEKTNKLHGLEKEWQEIYFQLLSKEDEIRKEEKELKGSLSEFISMYKNSLSRKEDSH